MIFYNPYGFRSLAVLSSDSTRKNKQKCITEWGYLFWKLTFGEINRRFYGPKLRKMTFLTIKATINDLPYEMTINFEDSYPLIEVIIGDESC